MPGTISNATHKEIAVTIQVHNRATDPGPHAVAGPGDEVGAVGNEVARGLGCWRAHGWFSL